jgi:hypothetical protein
LVGRIFNNRGESGTGALVGDRIVITAGHMVPWGDSPWWMRFVPAYYDGASLHGAGIESYVSDARGYNTSGSVTGYDWAVLRLYEPLGQWLGYFGYNGYSDNWNDGAYWSLIGYPGAIANAQRPSFRAGSRWAIRIPTRTGERSSNPTPPMSRRAIPAGRCSAGGAATRGLSGW